jgi:hypothetical protein
MDDSIGPFFVCALSAVDRSPVDQPYLFRSTASENSLFALKHVI